jgi:hypothetical protein
MAEPTIPELIAKGGPAKSLVQVGGGRGFVVKEPMGQRFVITAVHL